MLRGFVSTSCILRAAHQIQRSLIAWPKRNWMIWPCPTAGPLKVSCRVIPRVSRGSLVFLPVCFTVGLAEATCKHAGRTNANGFHQFPISPFHHIFASFSHVLTIFANFSECGQRNHCIRSWKENCSEGARQTHQLYSHLRLFISFPHLYLKQVSLKFQMPLYNPRSSRFWFRELWNLGPGRFSTVEEWECAQLGGGLVSFMSLLKVNFWAVVRRLWAVRLLRWSWRIQPPHLEHVFIHSCGNAFLPQLTVDQTWKEKELVVVVVVETYLIHFPAHCARELAIEVYRDQTSSVGEDLTVGAKLNLTILLASGQYIVSFDDDLYADRYAEHNVLCIHVGIGHGDCHATAKLGRRDIVRFAPPDTVTATKFRHSSKLEVQDEHFNLIFWIEIRL